MADTPRVDAIALRLVGKTGLFCDDESLSQYNDLVDEASQLERELAQANAELAAERDIVEHWQVAHKEEYVRAESAECRAEEAERVLRLGLRYFGADAETVMLTIAEDGSTLADFQEQARAFLDAAKKEGKG